MAFRDSPWQALRAPLTWAAAAVAVVAGVIALGLFLTDRHAAVAGPGYGAARSDFDELIEPVASVASAPVRWATSGAHFGGGYFFAVSQNQALRKRVAELQHWQDEAIALRNLSRRYEQLLKLRTDPPIPMASARVVADTRGPFANARLADAGALQGVKVGNPVMSEHGVVGRVLGVTRNASRVLLLTDVESRTPVLMERTDARAVLTGDGSANPKLEFVRGQNAVKEGDIVLTSGDGGLYPRGLPVGVAAHDVRGGWRVRLYSDRAAIDLVRILLFDDFSQTVDQTQLNASEMPPLSTAEQAQVAAQTAAATVTPQAALSTPSPGKTATAVAMGATNAAKPVPAAAKAKPAAKRPGPHEYRRIHVQTAPYDQDQSYPQYQGPPIGTPQPQGG